ncbi:MAG: hypothetical protein LUQ33_01410 [Methanoregulaceae archaeon]|nr:hypothetical protein [Methanoregulaceae archaeon]
MPCCKIPIDTAEKITIMARWRLEGLPDQVKGYACVSMEQERSAALVE